MEDYDSDSSGLDDGYTETNVLLGFASKDATDDVISHLGGSAEWLSASSPSAKLARCKVCNQMMCLLLQLNGELPKTFPGHERRLYLFACRNKRCKRKEGSVCALRATRIPQVQDNGGAEDEGKVEAKEEKGQRNIGEGLFGVAQSTASSMPSLNPFAKNGSAAPVNPFSTVSKSTSIRGASTTSPLGNLSATFAEKATISVPQESSSDPIEDYEAWPEEKEMSNPFPQFYLDADYESIELPRATQQKIPEVEPEQKGPESEKDDKVLFESTMDSTFQKFADRLANNPEQILRYEYAGAPLLYSKADRIGKLLASHHEETTKVKVIGGGVPPCPNCGSRRVFELQLTPHAIVELEKDDNSLDGMEWGTIIMAVCSKDCLPRAVVDRDVGYAEEWIGVQWEEVGGKGS